MHEALFHSGRLPLRDWERADCVLAVPQSRRPHRILTQTPARTPIQARQGWDQHIHPIPNKLPTSSRTKIDKE